MAAFWLSVKVAGGPDGWDEQPSSVQQAARNNATRSAFIDELSDWRKPGESGGVDRLAILGQAEPAKDLPIDVVLDQSHGAVGHAGVDAAGVGRAKEGVPLGSRGRIVRAGSALVGNRRIAQGDGGRARAGACSAEAHDVFIPASIMPAFVVTAIGALPVWVQGLFRDHHRIR